MIVCPKRCEEHAQSKLDKVVGYVHCIFESTLETCRTGRYNVTMIRSLMCAHAIVVSIGKCTKSWKMEVILLVRMTCKYG